jgi:hypothetical protein
LVVRGHVRDAGFFYRVGDLIGLGEAHAHRLLAEDVFPRGRRVEDSRGVQMVRQADVDGVDLATHLLQHLLPVGKLTPPAADVFQLLASLFEVVL